MPDSKDAQFSNQDDQVFQFSKHVHSYIRDYINLADQKAAFIFAIGTSLLAFLNQSGITKVWKQGTMSLISIVVIISLVSIGSSVLLSILVVAPNLNPGSGRRGYIFWESIMKYGSSERYLEDIETKQVEELTRAMLEHCYVLAGVCRRKYKYLRYSIFVGAIGIISTLSILFLL